MEMYENAIITIRLYYSKIWNFYLSNCIRSIYYYETNQTKYLVYNNNHMHWLIHTLSLSLSLIAFFKFTASGHYCVKVGDNRQSHKNTLWFLYNKVDYLQCSVAVVTNYSEIPHYLFYRVMHFNTRHEIYFWIWTM